MANTLIMENAKIRFRNFSGRPDEFTREGDRSFALVIDDEDLANKLKEDGWNVRMRMPKNDGEDPWYYLKVKVNFGGFPPKIIEVTSRNRVSLNEETVGILDSAELKSVDVEISPYHWEIGGRSGITAYLKTMYATIEEDPFAAEYELTDIERSDSL